MAVTGAPCRFFGSYIPTVQPIGDSITEGAFNPGVAAWREGLYNAGAAGGTPSFRFVGSMTSVVGGLTVNPNHEGHSGYVVRTGTVNASLTDVTNAQVPVYGPDVCILFGGTNDLDPAVGNDSPATLANSLGIWLDAAWSLTKYKAWSQIVVFTLLKRLDATDTQVQAYNPLIPGVISGKSYASRVWLVDIYNSITRQVVGQGYLDNEHPSAEGYNQLAGVAWASSNFQAALAAARPR